MNPSFDHVLFDLDGTLIDSAPAILECFRDVLAWRGIEPRTTIDQSLIGPPLLATMARLSGVEDGDELHILADAFKQRYDRDGPYRTPAFAGVGAALESLVRGGRRLHIATNKRSLPTRLILEHLVLDQYFASVYALDRTTPPYASKAAMIASQLAEQGIDVSRACYIGDKPEDGAAAEANGLAFYFADWGYGAGEVARMPAHWRRLATPAELGLRLA